MKNLLILLFFISLVYSNSDNHNQDRPNILLIYSDDHTFQAVSAYESFLSGVVETPNLMFLNKHFQNYCKKQDIILLL